MQLLCNQADTHETEVVLEYLNLLVAAILQLM